MKEFSIEEVYGVSRAQYCNLTGISHFELMRHLEEELMVLHANYERLSDMYRIGGSITDEEHRKLSRLLKVISNKIESKSLKIKDIKLEFGL